MIPFKHKTALLNLIYGGITYVNGCIFDMNRFYKKLYFFEFFSYLLSIKQWQEA